MAILAVLNAPQPLKKRVMEAGWKPTRPVVYRLEPTGKGDSATIMEAES
ncbi:MAG: hypothetical protein ACFB0G_05120 [Leptolyngbyaceae cyanobacterium]